MLPTNSTYTRREYISTGMPDFTDMKALVLPGAFYGSCVGLMAEAGFQKAKNYEEADVVVFIGGEDVNPSLYGEAPHRTTHFTEARDHVEKMMYGRCLLDKKPMLGICRGAQFLHVMNGGKLWQNVNNHAGRDHSAYDIDADVYFDVTSIHHQMLRMNEKLDVIAICSNQLATSFEDGTGHTVVVNPEDVEQSELEIEAGAYNDTRCFFVQGHPEIGSPQYRSWTMTRFFDYVMSWGEERPTDEVKTLDSISS